MVEPLSVAIVDSKGERTGTAELPAEIFDVEPNIPLMHQVVVAQLAAARQGTHATRTRGMVRGGGRKPYRQKGTGRARQDRARNGRVHVITEFLVADRPSTKQALSGLRNLTDRKALVVVPREDALSLLSLRNLPDVLVIRADQLNTYDVLNSDDVVFTAAALDRFLGRSEEESK